jgi:formylglycine-generating enzyme required for sulfatase activity
MKNVSFVFLIFVSLFFFTKCTEPYNENPTIYMNIETVLITAGSFQMGNTGNFSGEMDGNSEIVHTVTITKSFYIGKYELTQAQWNSLIDNNPSQFKGDNLPVEMVSFLDAVDFCNKLSEKYGLTKCYTINGINVSCNWSANGWRLPTEAEWEYACKAGTTTDFYNGSLTHEKCSPIDTNLDKIGWYCGNYNSKTHPVGLNLPNAFGLYDMCGNVWEWCWDRPWNYGTTSVTDPKGDLNGVERAKCGGAYNFGAAYCRSAASISWTLNDRGNNAGFRICRNKD